MNWWKLIPIFGRDNQMKTTYGKVVIVVLAILFVMPGLCAAGEERREMRRPRQRFEMTDEMIERMMDRLADTAPERAKELNELREKDPEKFKIELRNAMREQFSARRDRDMRPSRGEGPMMGRRGDMDRPDDDRKHGEMGRWGQFRDRLRDRHDEYIEWLEENYPEEAEKLADLREDNPELYRRKLALSWRKYGRIAEASEDNPKLAEVLKKNLELDEQRDELLQDLRTAKTDEEKQKLTAKLKELVSVKFDLRLERKQIEYEQLLARLEELKKEASENKAELDKWKDRKDEEVQKRLERLLSRTEKFDWD